MVVSGDVTLIKKYMTLASSVSSTSRWMLSAKRTSTAMAVASPPTSLISRATVLIVESGELGSGGNGAGPYASLVVFAATTTGSRRSLPVDEASEFPCELTGIIIPGQVYGDLPSYSPRCADHDGYRLVDDHVTD
jgi:hypothetical protein